MALINPRFKDQKLVSFGGRGANREERKREKKRRGRGRREEEEGGIKPRYGTTNLEYGSLVLVWLMVICCTQT